MTAERIFFWRHGQTDWNKGGKIQGSSDIPLNETGRAQAESVAPQLAQMGITKIYVSDLVRAKETADTVSRRIGLEPIVDARLRERGYGQWEGLSSEDIKERWPDKWAKWREGYDPEGVDVETRLASGERFAECVRESMTNSNDDDVLLFVAHGAVISAGIMCLLGQNPSEFSPLVSLDNCHWALMNTRHGAPDQLRLRSYNRVLARATDLDLINEEERAK